MRSWLRRIFNPLWYDRARAEELLIKDEVEARRQLVRNDLWRLRAIQERRKSQHA